MTKPPSAKRTHNVLDQLGSEVYELAVTTNNVDESVCRSLLHGALLKINMSPDELTVDDLGVLLPQLESHFRAAIAPDKTDAIMSGLRRVVLSWGQESNQGEHNLERAPTAIDADAQNDDL